MASIAAVLFFGAGTAHAYRASQFKGGYEVTNAGGDPAEKKYFLCDVDTVAVIWEKYGSGELPKDLVPIKDEPVVFAAFTFRNEYFFTLESIVMVNDRFLAVPGNGSDRMELYNRGNGTYQLAVRFKEQVTTYELGPKFGIDRFSVASGPAARIQGEPAAEWAIAASHGQP